MKQIFIVLVVMAFAFSVAAKSKERPNILIILSDDQGWGDVGFNVLPIFQLQL